MKTFKIIALLALFVGAFGVSSAFAQSDDDSPPPMMSSFSEEEGVEDDSYNNTVTIDEEDSGESSDSYDSYESSSYSSAPKKERLRVYSGKHSGNNVVSDPRRD